MKRYIITYWDIGRSKPYLLTQISKSGKWDGVRIFFFSYGNKYYQYKYKNGLVNGIDKVWWRNTKNWNFRNWKKHKKQGIEIEFE